MALNKGENAGMIYLTVANGKLVRQHKEANKDTVSRVNKKGNTVHEEFFKDLTGVIQKIEVKEDKGWGKQWQVVFADGADKYMVQMNYSGRYSSSFLKALPNTIQGQPVRFMPWEMDDKNRAGKTITGVTLYQDQDGNGMTKIPSAYTKEDPNGLPEMKKVRVKGVDTWDDEAMMLFFENMVKEWFLAAPDRIDDDGKELEEAPF